MHCGIEGNMLISARKSSKENKSHLDVIILESRRRVLPKNVRVCKGCLCNVNKM